MSVVQVSTLPIDEKYNKGEILKKLITELSAAIETPEERIFGTWNTNDVQVDRMQMSTEWSSDSHPPIVRIDMFEGRSKEKKARALEAVTAALKESLDFAGNPFVYIFDISNGQVHTGGKVIQK